MAKGRIAITGSNGYVGAVLSAQLACDEKLLLSREKPVDDRLVWMPFNLDRPVGSLPTDVTAVIHLAADVELKLSLESELAGIRDLLSAARAVGAKFIFVSSQSALSPQSEYGERKAAAEKIVSAEGGCIVRPGLVVGGREPHGLAKLLARISRSPVLPNVGSKCLVQPIHVLTLAEALIAIARAPITTNYDLAGAPAPVSDFLASFRKCATGRGVVFIPFPGAFLKLISIRARKGVRGSVRQMINLVPLKDDTELLGITHIDARLGGVRSNRPYRRALLRECKALLDECGVASPSSSMLRHYVRLVQQGYGPAKLLTQPLRLLEDPQSRFCSADVVRAESRRRRSIALFILDHSRQGASTLIRLRRERPLKVFLRLTFLAILLLFDSLARFTLGGERRH
jgi:nucleoside-diphosphate-sugar epimerase